MKKITLLIVALILCFTPLHAQTEALVDFSGASIREIQSYVDQGVLNYETITKIYLERIEAYNDDYNAIISINENAIEEAKQLDQEFKENGRRSLLHGIPVLVKDNIDVKDLPTTAGAKGLENNIANNDATIIKNLRDQGAIVIAKANMDEFAFNAGMSYSSYGLVSNAYDLDKTSYGSSGGSATGVAADLAVVGIGTDTGTSIRLPSSAANLYGLRPTKGSLSADGMITFESLRDTAGPMAKHAEDAILLFEAMRNEAFEQVDVVGLRIGIVQSKMNEAPFYVRNLIENKIDELESLGVEFVDVSSLNLAYNFDADNLCYEFNQHIKNTTGPIRSLEDLVDTGEYVSYVGGYISYYCDVDYHKTSEFKSYQQTQQNKTQIAKNYFVTQNVDAILYPTLMETVQDKSAWIYNSVSTYSADVSPQTGFTAINIPAGFDDGLAYGMQILAPTNQDDLLLSLALALDELNPSYVLPDISPALYQPIPQIETLLSLIQVKHKQQEYKEVQKAMQSFIDHYANLSHREETANRLIAFYDGTQNYLLQKDMAQKELSQARRKIGFALLVEMFLFFIWWLEKRLYVKKRKQRRG